MRIAQVSTLASPVRPDNSHSVEQIVWLLTEQLVRMGHDVTVFACAGSQTSGRLIQTLPGPYARDGSPGNWQTCETINLCQAIQRSDEFDVLHSHAYLWGLPLEPFSKSPMVHTLHIQPFQDEAILRRSAPRACVTAISQAQWKAFPDLAASTPVIHHAVDPAQFTFRARPDDYVCFLGRMIPEKGVLAAIEVAKRTRMRLLLAGPENEYFRRHVLPLVDGRDVQYVGSVTGAARDRLLGGARALLYPITQPEPFGLVLAEAMMCGTPVAAMALGAATEIIDEGITGYCADSLDELADCLLLATALDRHAVRLRAHERFHPLRMAQQYLQVYQRAIEAFAADRDPGDSAVAVHDWQQPQGVES
ncbi:MAG TPA: glycosyltransferase family 4 protein [Tepidisphaeraceae bacterium]|nr:glycosyltransferase family 4 protein [Tepidisphaeraceae bacterium]